MGHGSLSLVALRLNPTCMLAINSELDRQWQLVGLLSGTPPQPSNALEQVVLQSLEAAGNED